ncbi:MFS transporter [bacterium]|nr:MFS transporter [bacterium]
MKLPFRNLPGPIWALFVVRLVISLGNFVFPFLTLILTVKLGWGADRAGLFLTLVQASALPGVFLGGKLSDAMGRKRIILACQGAAAALFFVCLAVGFVPALPFLIGGASVILSMTWPVMGALVADLAPPESRKDAYALLYWGNNIGFSLGPLAAGFLFHRAPGLMFIGNACVLSASIAIMAKFIPETGRAAGAAARAATATRGGPEAAAPGGGAHSDGSRRGGAHPADSSVEAAAERAFRGGLWALLRQRPTILLFACLIAVMNFVYGQNGFTLPLFLNEALGARGSEVFGSAMTVNGLTVVLCTPLLARLTGALPALCVMAIASLFYGLGFGMLALNPGFLLVMVSTVVWTWGEILSATNLNVFVASKTPSSHRGRVNSLVTVVGNLGSLSAPFISGRIVAVSGAAAVWPVAGIVAGVAAALMLGLWLYDRARGPGEVGL